MTSATGIAYRVDITIRSFDIDTEPPEGCRLMLRVGPTSTKLVQLSLQTTVAIEVPALKVKDTLFVALWDNGKVLSEAAQQIPLAILTAESKEMTCQLKLVPNPNVPIGIANLILDMLYTRRRPDTLISIENNIDGHPSFVEMKIRVERLTKENKKTSDGH
eukprot:TRINITY_DN3977_c0_g1_i1.p1 TRINITY_DN3977_c0_g1~~TRINITY_DN3977_c0_g1_i1.p1  ORF type:complete len:161 (-),score=31.95 TRINITY_DN3977_c0_g1_i1:79-561(-)